MKDLCRNKGLTVMCTIHQPNSNITAMFDDLLLLAKGRVVYQGTKPVLLSYYMDIIQYYNNIISILIPCKGPFEGAVGHFAACGFTCPLYSNPVDFYIKVIADENLAETLILEHSLHYKSSQFSRFSNIHFIYYTDFELLIRYHLFHSKNGQVDRSDVVAIAEDVEPNLIRTGFLHQTRILAYRASLQWLRDPGMFVSELIQYIFLALFLGGL